MIYLERHIKQEVSPHVQYAGGHENFTSDCSVGEYTYHGIVARNLMISKGKSKSVFTCEKPAPHPYLQMSAHKNIEKQVFTQHAHHMNI